MACFGLATPSRADTHYVNKANTTPLPGYTNGWSSAATNIQDAINWAANGDIVLVTNGVYDTGGVANWPAGSLLTNRVALTNSVIVLSVNGPAFTFIVGAKVAGGCGPAAVRCAYVGNAALIGFTLTNGATLAVDDTKGGVYGGGAILNHANSIVSNCVFVNNVAAQHGGGLSGNGKLGSAIACLFSSNSAAGGGAAYNTTLIACTATYNSASSSLLQIGGGGLFVCTAYDSLIVSNTSNLQGGGTHRSDLSNCWVVGNSVTNSAAEGGGVARGTLYDCRIANNSSKYRGGGMSGLNIGANAYRCTFQGNYSADSGGGVYNGTLFNCTVISNSASPSGGGISYSTAYNTLVAGNQAGAGGGANYSTLVNCTVVFNSATNPGGFRPGGGGLSDCAWTNTISYFNDAPAGLGTNYVFYEPAPRPVSYSCSLPLPPGISNIAADPLLVDKGSGVGTNHVPGNYRLGPHSPCQEAALFFNWMLPGDPDGLDKDLDGNKRIWGSAPDIGAYEKVPSMIVISTY